MERISQFGETWDILLAEDYIVAKFTKQWPPGLSLPDGCKLENDSLVTNQESLVAAKNALRRGPSASRALFAGCAEFESSMAFRDAARVLLREAEELCVVHNRNAVYTLIRMFPKIRVLSLPHDLCKHALEVYEPMTAYSSSPLMAERSELTQLLGNVEGWGTRGLILSDETVRAVLRTCPRLRRIDADMVLEALLCNGSPAESSRSTTMDLTHFSLCSGVFDTGRQVTPAGLADVALAARTFPLVEDLEVFVQSVDAVGKIAAFTHVRNLLVALGPPVVYANAHPQLERLLRNLPCLQKLALEFWGGVRLSAIATLCPRVKSLRLAYCRWSGYDCPVAVDEFPELEGIELAINIGDAAFDALFVAVCGRLRTAELYDDGSCRQFLHFCARQLGHFPRLEELQLATKLSVRTLGLKPEMLHDVLRALPSLRHLVTDSYDLRLFFENCYIPHGQLTLSWAACVLCAVYGEDVPSRQKAASSVASSLTGAPQAYVNGVLGSQDVSCSLS